MATSSHVFSSVSLGVPNEYIAVGYLLFLQEQIKGIIIVHTRARARTHTHTHVALFHFSFFLQATNEELLRRAQEAVAQNRCDEAQELYRLALSLSRSSSGSTSTKQIDAIMSPLSNLIRLHTPAPAAAAPGRAAWAARASALEVVARRRCDARRGCTLKGLQCSAGAAYKKRPHVRCV
jgi:hypothetical protein